LAVFIDTGGFIASRNEDDNNYKAANEIMKSILTNEYGKIFTSDYVFDEAVTLALVRTKNIDFALDIADYILKSKKINLIFTIPDDFYKAWELFLKYKDKKMSFTDCIILNLVEKLGIKYIFSFDPHFDGLIQRVY